MPIEIRELIIKVKVDESSKKSNDAIDAKSLKSDILKEMKREMQKELRKLGER